MFDTYWQCLDLKKNNVLSVEDLQNRWAHAPGIDFVTDSEWFKQVADVNKGTITLEHQNFLDDGAAAPNKEYLPKYLLRAGVRFPEGYAWKDTEFEGNSDKVRYQWQVKEAPSVAKQLPNRDSGKEDAHETRL